MNTQSPSIARRLVAALLGLLFCGLVATELKAQGEVSCYCSLDQPISEAILLDFEKQTGIKIVLTFDTEATKTVGLVNRIISERKNPRCDVYWNNELAQTIRLKNEGLLLPYESPSAADIPDAFKDPEHYWTGFAARARVIIYNTQLVSEDDKPDSLQDMLAEAWDGKRTMAKPLTGTTLTHAGALFAVWGEEKAKDFFRQIKKRDTYFAPSNGQTMRTVSDGDYAWGYTDTDDANVSKINDKPTGLIIPDQGPDQMGTLVIPNSVAIVKGGKNFENAKKLVDYILSAEVEQRLAAGRSAQIPLRQSVEAPEGVLKYDDIKRMEVDWNEVAEMISTHGEWLKSEFDGQGEEETGTKGRLLLYGILGAIFAVIAVIVIRKKS